LFEKAAGGVGCAACHGHFALGDLQIAPNVRGVDEDRIRGALEGAEEMEFLIPVLTNDDIASLAQYLQYLAPFEPFKTTRKRGVFDPLELLLPLATDVQLIVNNGDRSECTFHVEGADVEDKLITGRWTDDLIWTTPELPGMFVGYCSENPDATVSISVDVLPDEEAEAN